MSALQGRASGAEEPATSRSRTRKVLTAGFRGASSVSPTIRVRAEMAPAFASPSTVITPFLIVSCSSSFSMTAKARASSRTSASLISCVARSNSASLDWLACALCVSTILILCGGTR